jgi:hypothetical protein
MLFVIVGILVTLMIIGAFVTATLAIRFYSTLSFLNLPRDRCVIIKIF